MPSRDRRVLVLASRTRCGSSGISMSVKLCKTSPATTRSCTLRTAILILHIRSRHRARAMCKMRSVSRTTILAVSGYIGLEHARYRARISQERVCQASTEPTFGSRDRDSNRWMRFYPLSTTLAGDCGIRCQGGHRGSGFLSRDRCRSVAPVMNCRRFMVRPRMWTNVVLVFWVDVSGENSHARLVVEILRLPMLACLHTPTSEQDSYHSWRLRYSFKTN